MKPLPIQGQALWNVVLNEVLTELQGQGTGSPEGVFTATVGTRYVDINATNGAVEWIKATGTGNTGWRVVYGDTGWRNVTALFPSITAGSVLLRREGSRVSLNLLGAVSSTAGDTAQITGFRGQVSMHGVFARGSGAVLVLSLSSAGYRIPTGEALNGLMTHFTGDAWPTTLPGTAAA